jgi:hypothetical protein
MLAIATNLSLTLTTMADSLNEQGEQYDNYGIH